MGPAALSGPFHRRDPLASLPPTPRGVLGSLLDSSLGSASPHASLSSFVILAIPLLIRNLKKEEVLCTPFRTRVCSDG
jgi:hypothetical protein